MNDEIEDEFPDPVVRNPPQRIFLNVGHIEEDCDFSELDEVCWANEPVDDADIEYVLAERLARLEDLRRWRSLVVRPKVSPCYVLMKDDSGDLFKGYWSGESWGDDCGVIPEGHPYMWTYIPGQEPAEAMAEMRQP